MIEIIDPSAGVTVMVGGGAGIPGVTDVVGEHTLFAAVFAAAGLASKSDTGMVHEACTMTLTLKLLDLLAATAGSAKPNQETRTVAVTVTTDPTHIESKSGSHTPNSRLFVDPAGFRAARN